MPPGLPDEGDVGEPPTVGPSVDSGLGGSLLPESEVASTGAVGPAGPEGGIPPVVDNGVGPAVAPLVGTGLGASVFDEAGLTPGWLGEATAIVVPRPATMAKTPVPRATWPAFRRRVRREPAARMARASSRAVERCA
jgi:hypothetical protein